MDMFPVRITRHSVVDLTNGKATLFAKAGEVNVPMFINRFDATCILNILQGASCPPEAFANIMSQMLHWLNATLLRLEIIAYEPQAGRFLSYLIITLDGRTGRVAVFESEGIMLALSLKAPIFITEEAMIAAMATPEAEQIILNVQEVRPTALAFEE